MTDFERVAIIGAGGHIGSAITRGLLNSGKHTVTAITRKRGSSVYPDGAQVVQVDYDDDKSLVSALKGQQFLIITLSVSAPSDLHGKIIKAADEAGVAYIMPNFYGSDIQHPAILEESVQAQLYKQRLADLDVLAQASWIILVCGYWYEFGLAAGKPFFGFDIAKRSVTFYDDGSTKIDVSTWDQCGRAVAGLLSLPESKEKSSTAACVTDWKNKPLYINSFKISQRDIMDSLHRVLGTTDKDWEIDFEPTEQRFNRGLDELKKGNRLGFPTASYARILYPNGDGDFGARWGISNEALCLPEDDLDDATKRAVGMVNDGWSPF